MYYYVKCVGRKEAEGEKKPSSFSGRLDNLVHNAGKKIFFSIPECSHKRKEP